MPASCGFARPSRSCLASSIDSNWPDPPASCSIPGPSRPASPSASSGRCPATRPRASRSTPASRSRSTRTASSTPLHTSPSRRRPRAASSSTGERRSSSRTGRSSRPRIYSVVVSPGVAVPGTGEASAVATRFQFETAAKGDASRADRFEFQDDVFESPTAERPVIGLWWYGDTESPPKRIHLEAYRLPDLDAAVAAFRSLRTQPDWASWSTEGLVDTAPLRRVVNVNAPLQPFENASYVRLPKALPAGWYLLQHDDGTRPIQAVLQVTDLAGYMAVSTTRTVVWANDLDGGSAGLGGDGPRERDTDGRHGRRWTPPGDHTRRPAARPVTGLRPAVRPRHHDLGPRWPGDVPAGRVQPREARRLRWRLLVVRVRSGVLEPHAPGSHLVPLRRHGQRVGRDPRPGRRHGPAGGDAPHRRPDR